MNHCPTVSIGMPVFNGEKYIEQAIESILTQTFTDFELVIADNASTDRTEAICRRYAAQDARVRYFRNASNIGAHPNYNRTFEESCGRYFKWAAHDDVLAPEFLAKNVAVLESDPGAVVCQSFLEYIDENEAVVGVYDSALDGSDLEDPVARFSSLTLRPHPCYEVMGLFRRSALEGSMLLESFHGADRALLAEMALRGRFQQVEEPLLIVRDHKERYTRARHKPRDRATWHDTRLAGKISLPTWRLYAEYWKMVGRNLASRSDSTRCRLVLCRWWIHNFNYARMMVDLIAVVLPSAVGWAEKIKQTIFRPAPGADELRRKLHR